MFLRLNTHGSTWNGQRSQFILSGLTECILCSRQLHKGTKWKLFSCDYGIAVQEQREDLYPK